MSVALTSPARPLSPQAGLRTLVLGAGEAGRALTRDLLRASSFGLEPIGLLDDDPAKRRRTVAGLRVLGTLDALEVVVEAADVEVVVLAIPSMSTAAVRELGRRSAALGVAVRHLPPFLTALQRDVAGTDMRTLQIGPLIGRPEIHVTSRGSSDVITGKRVLVTGAG